jgi:hypothetical protein
MRIAEHQFDLRIELSDLERIRSAIRRWGKPAEVADAYDGSLLYRHVEAWHQFVKTDWGNWDASEYDHDIGCRVWVQLAIENSCAGSSERIELAVRPADEHFRASMVPAVAWCRRTTPVLDSHPYFWETHTIHPELRANGAA